MVLCWGLGCLWQGLKILLPCSLICPSILLGHMNLFASGGNQSFNPLLTMIQPGSQPDVWHSNGRYPSATIFGDNGRNGLFSSPFGGRKRTLDDEHGDRVKRQRVCGGERVFCLEGFVMTERVTLQDNKKAFTNVLKFLGTF